MSTISNDEVAIRITVDQNQANQAILEINDNLKVLTTGSEKAAAGTDKTSFSFTELNQALELGSKALSLITGGYAQLAEVMDRGNDVAEVTANFEKLQQSVGSDATQALEGLRVATQGTVSDFDLMTASAKAVRAGIPTDAFIQGAESAVKLGEAMGVDAAQAMDILTTAMGKGNDRILQQIGVNVDLQSVYDDYAAKLGTTADKLGELEKREAAQAAILDTVNESAKGAAEGAGGAGEAFQTIGVAIENQLDKAYAAIAGNEDLENAFKQLAIAVNEVDLTLMLEQIGNIAKVAADALIGILNFAEGISVALGQAAREAAGVESNFRGLKGTAQSLSVGMGEVTDEIREQIYQMEALADKEHLTAKEAQVLAKLTSNLRTELQNTSGVSTRLKDAFNDYEAAVKLAGEETTVNKEELEKLKKSLDSTEKVIVKTTKTTNNHASATSEAIDEQKKWGKELDELERTLSGETEKALEEFQRQLKELQTSNPDKDIYELAKSLDETAIAALKAGASIGDIKNQIEEVKKEAGDGSFLDQLLGIDGGIQQGFEEAIGSALQSGISDLISALGEGGSVRNEVANMGASIGAAIGTAIGGPIGAAIGQAVGQSIGDSISQIGTNTEGSLNAIGDLLEGFLIGFGTGEFLGIDLGFGEFLNHAFGGRNNAAANAREALEDIFNQAIDEMQLNGLNIEDFTDFGRDAFDPFLDAAGESTTMVGQMFETLSEDAQVQFQGLGTALEQALQVEGLEEGQLGQLLAANFGMGANSLNDLQLLINQMGISLEEVSAQLENAFLMGDITAGEFLNSLNQIRDLYEQGIPGAIGDTQAALNNFKEDSLSSGAAAQDALGDLAAEFQEYNESIGDTGEKTIQDLLDYLVSTGQITTEEASQMFQAFSAAGIDSLEGLMNASAEQTAVIVNNLESLGYAFQDNVESAQELREELDAIKDKEINIRLNVTSNISDEDRELLNQTNTNIPQGQGT